MIAQAPEFRRPILEPPERNPLPFEPRPGPGGDLFQRLDFVGTAHFEEIQRLMAEVEAKRAGLRHVGLIYSSPATKWRERVN